MDQRGLLAYGITFVLIGVAIFAGGWFARRHLKSLGVWSVTLWGNALLAGGLARLMKAGVIPGEAGAARWLNDGVFVLGMAGFICFLLQVARDSRSESARVRLVAVESEASQAAATQTDAAGTAATANKRPTVQAVGQGRN